MTEFKKRLTKKEKLEKEVTRGLLVFVVLIWGLIILAISAGYGFAY